MTTEHTPRPTDWRQHARTWEERSRTLQTGLKDATARLDKIRAAVAIITEHLDDVADNLETLHGAKPSSQPRTTNEGETP